MRYLIEHETVLDYPNIVREHHIELRLAPRSDSHQTVNFFSIATEPASDLASYKDFFGNRVDYFCVIPGHNRLITRLRADVTTTRDNPFDFAQLPQAGQQAWLKQALQQNPALHDFILHRSSVVPAATRLSEATGRALPRFEPDRTALQNLQDLMAWIPTVLEYRSGATAVHADLAEALHNGAGVCQDFAHLFIAIARDWKIPARYVMGYLDPGVCQSGEELATHAWAEALVPGGDWIGFDATHNLLANDRYVAVAVGRDSFDAAPQRGSFKGESAGEQPSVTVSVQAQ